MTIPGLGHLREDGSPCTAHQGDDELDVLLAFALLGTRHAGFNHDIASKLQGLLMSLDEVSEGLPAEGDPSVRTAAESAIVSSQDLGKLLNANRALAKPAARTRGTLREVMQRASERTSVTLRGAIPDAPIDAALPVLVQALALTLDVAAGPGRGRGLAVASAIDGAMAQVALTVVAPEPPDAAARLRIALAVLKRERGDLRCSASGDRIILRLPVAG